jgi:putative aldouronate transport system substrate-binding protein
MGATVDSVFLVDTESGELVYGPATEESRAYLELATDYYAKGYIDDSFISIVSNDSSPFTSGTLGTWEAMGQELATYQDTYGVRVYACPLIRGDGLEQGQTAVGDSASSYVSDLPGMAVTTACKDLEVALTFMDWFYSDDGALIANYGWEEGMTYEVLPDGTYQELPFMEKTDEATGCSNKGINTIIGDFGLVYPNISLELANEVQQEAAEGWTADPEFDGYIYKTLPSALALTADESNEVSSKFTDIETYTQTKILSWICGQETLDDAAWAAYLSDLDSMGIEVCKEAYTSAYERYGRK